MPGFSSTVVYDALTDDEALEALPALLAARHGARSSLLVWHHADGSASSIVHNGYFSDEVLGEYGETFAPYDPWLIATVRRGLVNVPMNLEALVPVTEYENSFFYNEFIRRIGDDTVRAMGVMTVNRFGTGLIALHRGKRQEGYMDDDVARLGTEAHHLRRMLAVRARLTAHGRRSAALEAILDNIRDAALLLGAEGGLVYSNAAGERLLDRADPFITRQGRLEARAAESDRQLQAALQAACHPAEPDAQAVLIERGQGPALVATVAPFRSPEGTRHALLIAHDDGASAAGAVPALRRLFGLTQAEAEIAARLADGLSPAEIADERGAARETVRSQLKSAAAKLGCRRQSEIVTLVRSIPKLG